MRLVLLMLPPSEGKTAPGSGPRLDLDSLLGAQRLTADRRRLMDELARVSGSAEAAAVLGLGARSAPEARLNLVLEHSPCAPAYELYTGVLFEAARMGRLALEPSTRAVLEERVLIISGLWGVLRATDVVPDHRLSMSVSLPGAGRLAGYWRTRLAPVVDPLANGLVLDCRSGAYSPAWRPSPGGGAELLGVRVLAPGADGALRVVSHAAKHTRGLVAGAVVSALAQGHLSESAGAEEVAGLAAGLEGVADVELGPVGRRGSRELTVVLGAGR